jgi:hypothetical protein
VARPARAGVRRRIERNRALARRSGAGAGRDEATARPRVIWRGGRVVECTRLESEQTVKGLGSSNLPLSVECWGGVPPNRPQRRTRAVLKGVGRRAPERRTRAVLKDVGAACPRAAHSRRVERWRRLMGPCSGSHSRAAFTSRMVYWYSSGVAVKSANEARALARSISRPSTTGRPRAVPRVDREP